MDGGLFVKVSGRFPHMKELRKIYPPPRKYSELRRVTEYFEIHLNQFMEVKKEKSKLS